MSTTCKVFIATSLDGFIAKPDGNIEWLDHPSYIIDGEDFGYIEFFSGIDAIVMGRNSYEKVLSFDIDWPYEKPVIVLSTKTLSLPKELEGKVILMNGNPLEITEQCTELGFHSLYIDGGITIQQFLRAGLIDELTITKIPVILGDGIPLFRNLDDILLELLKVKSYDNGFVQLTYKPKYT